MLYIPIFDPLLKKAKNTGKMELSNTKIELSLMYEAELASLKI